MFVDISDKEVDIVGLFVVDLSVDLGFFIDYVDEGVEWYSVVVSEVVIEVLLFYEVGEDVCVGGEVSDGDVGVFIDGEEFFLV